MKKENRKKIKKSLASAAAFLLCLALFFPIAAGDINAAGKKLIPLGRTTGIKMFSGGAMVVGFASLQASGGASPAETSGLRVGDVISAVNGQTVECNEELSFALSKLKSDSVTLTVKREDQSIDISLNGLIPNETGEGYRLGAWVRDSMAGIGTITFVDPETGNFGALGHGICDVDTGVLMPFDNGSIMESTVTGAVKGISGSPGQLLGTFNLKTDNGVLFQNTGNGIFGKITDSSVYSDFEAIETASGNEVKCGKVEIVSNINGDTVEKYSAKITKILGSESGSSRNFMLEITDPRLIDSTGGIVQGMSGSPVLQNGKLVGAVTHVLISDPEKGYGIFIENMLKAAG